MLQHREVSEWCVGVNCDVSVRLATTSKICLKLYFTINNNNNIMVSKCVLRWWLKSVLYCKYLIIYAVPSTSFSLLVVHHVLRGV